MDRETTAGNLKTLSQLGHSLAAQLKKVTETWIWGIGGKATLEEQEVIQVARQRWVWVHAGWTEVVCWLQGSI